MENKEQRPSVVEACDKYLDFHGMSDARVGHVVEVLKKFDAMVSLARDRALSELYVPSNVYQMHPRGWTIRYGGDES